MAKQATVEAKPGPITRLRAFLKEVMVELKKVTWPSKDDLKMSTKVTMMLLLIMAAIIFVYDNVFQFIIVGFFGLFG